MASFWNWKLTSPEYRLVPDLLIVSIEKPPARSKSTARAPALIVVTCAMS